MARARSKFEHDAHDACLVARAKAKFEQMMLMMLASWWPVLAADAHDASLVARLMLMMLAWWRVPGQSLSS